MGKELTRQEVRSIAKEEALKVNEEIIKKIDCNTEIMQRLERLLLGEAGVDEEDTLKARANFAYLYAKRNTEANIISRAMPAIKWFEDMSQKEPGVKESKLDTLGRVIGLFMRIEWLMTLFGISTAVNFFVAAKIILDFITNNFSGI